MTNRVFGSYDGIDIIELTIRSEAGAEAKIITWGGVVRDLIVPAKAGVQRVVLGFEEFDHYRYHSPHFGSNPGRFANRIANGRFTLDGVAYELDRKNHSPHTLHGGTYGFGVKPWAIVAQDAHSVTLALVSE